MKFLVSRHVYLVTLLLYAIAGIILLPYYQYQINPDGVSYISVATNYLDGDIDSAINGYWGPLFSWILIPFLAFGLAPLLATKVMALFVGLLVFTGANILAKRYEINRLQHNLMLITLIPITLIFVFKTITPDLLSTSILLFYLAYIFDSNYGRNKTAGGICGALGGIAYLAKNYMFPFFLVHFVAFNFIHYFSTESASSRKSVLNNLLAGLLVFFTITGTWIGAISAKYGELTIGTNVGYNLALAAPGATGHPIYQAGLIEPSDDDATSVWEDPSQIEMEPLPPTETFKSIKHLVSRTLRNLRAILRTFRRFSFAVPIVALVALLYCLPIKKKRLQNIIFFTFSTVLIYCSGYSLIWILPRYLWVTWLLMLMLGFHILNHAFKLDFFSRTRAHFVLFLFVFSFWISPVRHLVNNLHSGERIYLLGQELSDYEISGKIVANRDWNNTSYLAFYNGYNFFGLTEYDLSEELFYQLQNNGIDYYFFWTPEDDDPEDEYPFLDGWEEVTENEVDFIRVYHLQDRSPEDQTQ